MKNTVVLFNTEEKLAKSDDEHIRSDALVMHKNGSQYLLTVHGDRYESNVYEDDIPARDYYVDKGMYKINALEAVILSKTSPTSKIFIKTLNKIKKRPDLLSAELNDASSRNIRSDIVAKGRELAFSKQAEAGKVFKQKVEAKEHSSNRQVRNILQRFSRGD